MKAPCVVRDWRGDELGKASAAISPPNPGRLSTWTAYLFVESSNMGTDQLVKGLREDESMTLQLADGRVGQFRVTQRNEKAGEYAIEGTGPLDRS